MCVKLSMNKACCQRGGFCYRLPRSIFSYTSAAVIKEVSGSPSLRQRNTIIAELRPPEGQLEWKSLGHVCITPAMHHMFKHKGISLILGTVSNSMKPDSKWKQEDTDQEEDRLNQSCRIYSQVYIYSPSNTIFSILAPQWTHSKTQYVTFSFYLTVFTPKSSERCRNYNTFYTWSPPFSRDQM